MGAQYCDGRGGAPRGVRSAHVTMVEESVAALLAAHSAPAPLAAFADAYLQRQSQDGADPEKLYAELRGVYDLLASRGRRPCAVRAFTPKPDEHGYECGGSVVEA